MLLDVPTQAIVNVLASCEPIDWARMRNVHRLFDFDDGHILEETFTRENATSALTLGEAARKGLSHTILRRVRQGIDPDTRDKEHPKYTPLHRATSGGHRGVVRLLLHMRASANARDRLGFCALHFAASQSVQLVQDLLVARCDVDATNLRGFTPLHSSAGMGRVDICEVLLDAGAQVGLSALSEIPSPSRLVSRAADCRVGADQEACQRLASRLMLMESKIGSDEKELAWHFSGSTAMNPQGDDETWLPFEVETAEVINRARSQSQHEAKFTLRGSTYRVDLREMMQTNLVTGTRRHIALRRRSNSSHWSPSTDISSFLA